MRPCRPSNLSTRAFERRWLLRFVPCALLSPLVEPFAGVARADEQAGFKLIVHPHGPARAASRELITDVFLKRVARWEDGEAIKPVDQRPDARPRSNFSSSILRRSVAAVRRYWQQQIFSGRGVPPPELASEEAVVAYVLNHRGAIGYVGAATDTASVRVLRVR